MPDAHAGGRESPKPALARLEGYRPVATAHVGLGRLPNGSLITYYKVTLDDGEELRFYAPIAGAIAIVELSNEQIERALEILQCDLTEHRWKRRHGDKEPPLN